MLEISNNVTLAEWEIDISAIRATGNGGQRVNKVATAIHLRFDIKRSSLPAIYKERLLASRDSRISKEGVIIIKAQSFRTQDMNKEDAVRYWDANTDGNNTKPKYEKIRNRIRKFVPFSEYQLSDEMKAKLCF